MLCGSPSAQRQLGLPHLRVKLTRDPLRTNVSRECSVDTGMVLLFLNLFALTLTDTATESNRLFDSPFGVWFVRLLPWASGVRHARNCGRVHCNGAAKTLV